MLRTIIENIKNTIDTKTEKLNPKSEISKFKNGFLIIRNGKTKMVYNPIDDNWEKYIDDSSNKMDDFIFVSKLVATKNLWVADSSYDRTQK